MMVVVVVVVKFCALGFFSWSIKEWWYSFSNVEEEQDEMGKRALRGKVEESWNGRFTCRRDVSSAVRDRFLGGGGDSVPLHNRDREREKGDEDWQKDKPSRILIYHMAGEVLDWQGTKKARLRNVGQAEGVHDSL